MRRPDYMQRTIAALTIQLWWRKILARKGRERRKHLRMQQHEAPAYLNQVQRNRVKSIYGPGKGNVFMYLPRGRGATRPGITHQKKRKKERERT